MEGQDLLEAFLFDQLRVDTINCLEEYITSERGTLDELKERFRRSLPENVRKKVKNVKALVDALEEKGVIGDKNVIILKKLAEQLELPELKTKIEEYEADCAGIFRRFLNATGSAPGFLWDTVKGATIHLKTVLSVKGVQLALAGATLLYIYGPNPEILKNLQAFLDVGAKLMDVLKGSVVFVLSVPSISSLKQLWQSYKDGSLKEKLKKAFNEMNELKKLSQGEEIDVEVTIDEEKYREARLDLIMLDVKGKSMKTTKRRKRRHSAPAVFCEQDVPEDMDVEGKQDVPEDMDVEGERDVPEDMDVEGEDIPRPASGKKERDYPGIIHSFKFKERGYYVEQMSQASPSGIKERDYAIGEYIPRPASGKKERDYAMVEDVETNIPRPASGNRERNFAKDSEKLKEAIKCNTEYQTQFMGAHGITSEKTDQIFTSLTVYYADKKQVRKEQAEGLSRSKLLREYTKRETGVKVKEYQNIFIGMKGENRNLLLTGKPGIGKTFFCEKVMRDWSVNRLFQNEENVENNHKIQFAYLLKFRQLSSQVDLKVNLKELLNCSPLLDDNSMIDDSLFEYLIKNPSEVLIILDGFDEYSQQHREEIASDFEQNYPNNSRAKMPIPALCSKLIKGKLLKNSVVLVSSRPGEAEELEKIHFDRYVEISGFSPEQVSEYVDKYFSEPEKQQAKIEVGKHIKTNENLVSFCHIPLLSFLLCWCLEKRISQSGITENLPAKITDIYDELVRVVVIKLHANLKYLEMSGNTLKILALDTLAKLAKLAANLLKHSKFIFDEEDMKNELTEEEIKNVKASGILHCNPPIRISAFESKSEFSFIHLTFQEYLAASFFVKYKEIPEKRKATGQTLVFMSGLCSREKDGKLMQKLIHQITPMDNHDDVNKLLLLQCLYEYGDDELTQLTIHNLYNKYCDSVGWISFAGVSDVEVKYISYFLDIRSLKQQHPQSSPGNGLRINDSSLTLFGVGVVCDSLVRNSFITQLILAHCRLDDKFVERLTGLLVNTRTTRLDLTGNKFTDKGAESICRAIIRPDCHVEELSLLGNKNITKDCMKTLTQLVEKHKPGVKFYM